MAEKEFNLEQGQGTDAIAKKDEILAEIQKIREQHIAQNESSGVKYNANALEDLKTDSIYEDRLDDFPVIEKYNKKPGLDDEEGQFKILGAVTTQNIYRRKKAGTSIAPAVGYMVKDMHTGQEKAVSKSQGVILCYKYGMRNAYITYRTSPKKDAVTGEVIQASPVTYLQPFPARTEAFTKDDRIVPAFKLDSNGSLKRPYELNIREEQCTPELWEIIMKDYEKGNKNAKRSRRGNDSDTEHRKYMQDLRNALEKEYGDTSVDDIFGV